MIRVSGFVSSFVYSNIKYIRASAAACRTMCASRAPPPNRSWVRDFFKDHPKLSQKSLEAYSGTRGTHDKPKVFCKLCLSFRINTILDQEAKEVEAGTWQVARTSDMIEMECA
jgi:hypothetical protein